MTITIGAQGGKAAQFEVRSKSAHVQYLKITVKRVEQPGMSDERDVAVVPGDSADLIVSPQRLVLPAGMTRVVRLVQFDTPEKEAVYRVFVQAVDAPADAPTVKVRGKIASSVKVNLVYGVVVYARPANEVRELDVDPEHKKVINTGSVHQRITRIGRCVSEKTEDCKWKAVNKNLFPGQSVTLPEHGGARAVVRADYQSEGAGARSQVWRPTGS